MCVSVIFKSLCTNHNKLKKKLFLKFTNLEEDYFILQQRCNVKCQNLLREISSIWGKEILSPSNIRQIVIDMALCGKISDSEEKFLITANRQLAIITASCRKFATSGEQLFIFPSHERKHNNRCVMYEIHGFREKVHCISDTYEKSR